MLIWYPFIFFFVSNSKEIPIYPPGCGSLLGSPMWLVCVPWPQIKLITNNMSQRRFILEITQKSPINVGVSLINKKAPVRRLFEPEAFYTK
jgi:hypothetical protein